jgi:type II secretory pathway pseudopilin PulG
MSADVKRTGFTLVEAIVILVIVVTIVAVLIMAVQTAREAARRQACMNNMKQLGLALHNYHDAMKRFPPSAALFSADGKPPYKACGPSFIVNILPYAEADPPEYYGSRSGIESPFSWTKNPLINSLTDTDLRLVNARDTIIPELLCPSNPNKQHLFPGNKVGAKIALTNYKAMGATNMVSLSYCLDPKGTTALPYPPVPVVASEHPDGVLFPGNGIKISDIKDGTAYTIMAVETIDDSGTTPSDAGSAWISGACATLVGLPSENAGKEITYEPPDDIYPYVRPAGFNVKYDEKADPRIRALRTYLAYDFAGADKGKYLNPSTGTMVGNTPKNLYGPSSGHPSVVNHLFADGSVHALRKDIDFCTYFFYITRNNNSESLPSWWD